jgi:hypothetical protein
MFPFTSTLIFGDIIYKLQEHFSVHLLNVNSFLFIFYYGKESFVDAIEVALK